MLHHVYPTIFRSRIVFAVYSVLFLVLNIRIHYGSDCPAIEDVTAVILSLVSWRTCRRQCNLLSLGILRT